MRPLVVIPAIEAPLHRRLRDLAGGESPVAFIAAHPDDETIGAGALLASVRNPLVIHITDGSPRNQRDAAAAGFPDQRSYAAVRRNETLEALAFARVRPESIACLGFLDQEASLDLRALTGAIVRELRKIAPAAVFTHPYEGGHPDHDATAFATHAALARMRAQGHPVPNLIEFTSYHQNLRPAGVAPSAPQIETGCFLEPAKGTVQTALSRDQHERKRKMLEAYRTQSAVLAHFQPTDNESFRRAPLYDFTKPPHPGVLYYEHFDWGMTGGRWRKLAREALEQFKRGVPL